MADYTVIRSRRRTIALEITRQGTALVRAPPVSYTHLTLPTTPYV